MLYWIYGGFCLWWLRIPIRIAVKFRCFVRMISDHNIEKKYEYRALLSYPVDGLENIKMYPGFMDLNSKNVFYFYDQNVANEYILDNKKAYMTIERLLPRCTFNYTKYLQRLSKIKQIPASISEYLNIDNFIETSVKDDVLANNLRQKIDKFVGDPCAFYNVTSLNSIKVNFRKMLPVGCRVYDLFECLIKLQQQTNSKNKNRKRKYLWRATQ